MSQRRDLEILLQMGSGRARDDFKMPRSGTGTIRVFRQIDVFLWKSISYASPRPTTTTKMTAIGLSCYRLFIKTIDFDAFLQCSDTLFMKSHFFILSLPRSLLKGFCVLCWVACRQGILLFSQETRPGQKTGCVGCEPWAYLSVEMQDTCLVESQDICRVETQDMCCVES